jgi:hypothetical protein
MVATLRPTRFATLVQMLPAALVAPLDAWSQRVARARVAARRSSMLREAAPLPPVVNGHTYLPHPWRD